MCGKKWHSQNVTENETEHLNSCSCLWGIFIQSPVFSFSHFLYYLVYLLSLWLRLKGLCNKDVNGKIKHLFKFILLIWNRFVAFYLSEKNSVIRATLNVANKMVNRMMKLALSRDLEVLTNQMRLFLRNLKKPYKLYVYLF